MTQYVWDEDIVLLEIDNTEGTRTQYTQGPGEWGMLVSQQVNTTVTYLGSDDRNNVRLLLPPTGIGTSANYKAFGSVLPTPGTPATPFQYGGNVGYYAESPTENTTDTEFYRTLHRIYRFHSGRFPQPDPTGINGGYNLYGYANNNPISWIDPAGTDPRSNVHRKPAQHAHAASSAQRLIHSFVTGVRSVSPVWFDSDNGLVIGPQDHPFLAFDASPMSHSYFRQVGGVFEGYGDDLNPVEWWKGLNQLAYTAGYYGFSAAGSAIWTGTIHIFTDWMTTDDPQTFGQSFGTVLMTVAPGIKKIPTPAFMTAAETSAETAVLTSSQAQALARSIEHLRQ